MINIPSLGIYVRSCYDNPVNIKQIIIFELNQAKLDSHMEAGNERNNFFKEINHARILKPMNIM